MDNILYIPFLNGIKFVDIAPLNIPAYLTKHFDDYLNLVSLAEKLLKLLEA